VYFSTALLTLRLSANEIFVDFTHGDPFYAFMFVDVFDDPAFSQA
jgi:CRISPR/Cas system-associated protein Csx1